jgi:hypothetical protein
MACRILAFGVLVLALAGCADFPAKRAVINSGSYDWADQVRDAQGFPLPGWGSVIEPSGGPSQ